MEALEGEWRASEVGYEAFESGAVRTFHPYRGVRAEPAGALPGHHVVGDLALKDVVAPGVGSSPGGEGGPVSRAPNRKRHRVLRDDCLARRPRLLSSKGMTQLHAVAVVVVVVLYALL